VWVDIRSSSGRIAILRLTGDRKRAVACHPQPTHRTPPLRTHAPHFTPHRTDRDHNRDELLL
jgi:hypothetical protein